MNTLRRQIDLLAKQNNINLLNQYKTGIEREGLRVTRDGALSQSVHPPALGSALTHPNISLDFSEQQLEFVTKPYDTSSGALQALEELMVFVTHNIEPEIIWNLSMPPRITDEQQIQIARFGSSNTGRFKELYRIGLAQRYGRIMQTISGIHFNFSFSSEFINMLFSQQSATADLQQFQNDFYLGLTRNFTRNFYILLYLFGASPTADISYAPESQIHGLEKDEHTIWGKYATSVRMSPIGYINRSRCTASVSLNSLEEYIKDLKRALNTPCPDFADISPDGQLNKNIFQIENEYYAVIRAKQDNLTSGRPLAALEQHGINYVEVRGLDISPYDALGMGEEQAQVLRMFLLYCALTESPPFTETETAEINFTQDQIALLGRDPGFAFAEGVTIAQKAAPVLEDMKYIAAAIGDQEIQKYIVQQQQKLEDPQCTPSARFYDFCKEQGSFFEAAKKVSETQAAYWANQPQPAAVKLEFEKNAEASLAAQASLEKEQQGSFEAFLEEFNAPVTV